MAYKGKYSLKNIKKYVGNPRDITYRSLWERRFMVYCDTNPSVLKWASEEIVIPYLHPEGKKRRYYPDFYAEIQTDRGIKEYIIEIKPKKQVGPPKKKNLYESKTWAINKAKWEAARLYCGQRNWEFLILTEDHIL